MNNMTKELINSYVSDALENKAYKLTMMMEEKGKTTRVGKFATPISKQEMQEVIDGIYAAIEKSKLS